MRFSSIRASFGSSSSKKTTRGSSKPILAAACGPISHSVSRASIESLERRVLLDGLAFTPLTPVSSTATTYSLATADINGDGKADLLVATNTGSINIFLGNGDGTFASPTSISDGLGSFNSVIVAADINTDGNVDIVAHDIRGESTVLFGNGDGNFQAPVSIQLGDCSANSIGVGDFNHDGHPDIISAGGNYGSLNVLLQNSDGSFPDSAVRTTVAFCNPHFIAVAVGNFDGDSNPDLVAVDSVDGGRIFTFSGNGDGTFAYTRSYSVAGSPNAVAVGDLNGDGNADIVVASADGSVSEFLGNGDGHFAAPTTVLAANVSQSAVGVTIADVNGDGHADILLTNQASGSTSYGQIQVLEGNGNGTFTAPYSFVEATASVGPAVIGDFNNDGRLDAAVPNGSTDTATVLLNVSQDEPLIALQGNALKILGTAGNDTVSVRLVSGNIVSTVNGETKSYPADSVSSIEIHTFAGADSINLGAGLPITFAGGMNGNDTIVSVTSTNDTYHGGANNDSIHAGQGNDSIFGSIGNDTLLSGSIGGDSLSSDTLSGGDGNDLITTGAGHDIAFGDNGSDSLISGLGNCTLRGNTGTDSLDGSGGGSDALSGGPGNDSLVGATGSSSGQDTLVGSAGADAITQGPSDNVVSDGSDTVTFEASQLAITTAPTDPTAAGSTLSLTVQIRDESGALVATNQSSVTVAITTGSGTLLGAKSVQAVNGVATFTDLSITQVDSYVLTVTDGALTSAATDPFNISAAAASQLKFSAQPADATAGDTISPDVTVTVEDQFGNTVLTDTSDVTLALTGGGTLSGTLTQPASAGVATFNDLSVDAAGSHTLMATDDSLTGDTSHTFNITAGAAFQVKFVGTPSSVAATEVIAPPFSVNIEDQFGNLVSTDTSPVTIAVASGAGTLTGTNLQFAVAGVATFNDLRLDFADTYTFTATDGMLDSDTSNSFIISAAPAKLAIITAPGTATAGDTLPLVVHVEDADGNLITSDNSNVTVMVASGSGSLVGTTTVAAVNGVATFTDLQLQRADTYTLTVQDGTLTTATTDPFTIIAGVPAQVRFDDQPTTTAVGATISPAVTVCVEDQFGNDVLTDTSSVTLALNGPGNLSGTLTVAAVAGQATFTDLSIDTEGEHSLGASDASLSTDTSTTFAVFGTPTQVKFSQEPGPGFPNAAEAPFTVSVEDAAGDVVATDTSMVTIVIKSGSGAISGTTTVQAVNGVATFSDISFDTEDTYVLTASDNSLATDDSSPFTIGPVV